MWLTHTHPQWLELASGDTTQQSESYCFYWIQKQDSI